MDKLEEYAIQSAFIRNQITEVSLCTAIAELEDSTRNRFINVLLFGKEVDPDIPYKYSSIVIEGYLCNEKNGSIESLKEILSASRVLCANIVHNIKKGVNYSIENINVDDTMISVRKASVAQVSIIIQRLKSAGFKARLE